MTTDAAALVATTGGAGATRLCVEVGGLLAAEGDHVVGLDAAYATQGLADHLPGRVDPDLTALVTDDRPLADGLHAVDGPDSLAGSLLIGLVAIGLLGYGVYDYVEQTDAVRDVVEVEATVVETGIEESDPPGRPGAESHYPTVEYTYRYDGQSYTSDRLSPGPNYEMYGTESAAREAIAGYEPNATVTAYVDPTDPDEAFLENEVSNTPIGLAALGGLGLLFGGASAVQNYRQR